MTWSRKFPYARLVSDGTTGVMDLDPPEAYDLFGNLNRNRSSTLL